MIVYFIFTFGVSCQDTPTFDTLQHHITPGLKSCPDNFGGGGRIVGEKAGKAKPNTWPWLVRIEMLMRNFVVVRLSQIN